METNSTVFTNDFSEYQWGIKYKFNDESTIDDTFHRVAKDIASIETDSEYWRQQFLYLLQDFKFVPGGRILSNAGTGLTGTSYINCFVGGFHGIDQDSIEGIYDAVKYQAQTLKSEGGYGFCADVMRPKGSNIQGIGNQSPGAVKFLELWDKSSEIITAGSGLKSKKGEKTGIRKGAQMVTMSVCHPDILEFINAKKTPGRLTKFNMSVLMSDAFMLAVENQAEWNLIFPNYTKYKQQYKQHWNGDWDAWAKLIDQEDAFIIHDTLLAYDLFNIITQNSYERNEPGAIYIDTVNNFNNLRYVEHISSSNPCGEQMLGLDNVCLLGSLNLVHYINPKDKDWDYDKLKKCIQIAVRFLDNVNDISNVPLKEQKSHMQNRRRIGLGIMGYASALLMAKVSYGSKKALELTENLMRFYVNEAYKSSALLAKEKGAFKDFKQKEYLSSSFIKQALDTDTINLIKKHGIRNSHLTSIQPTGNSAVVANIVSGGCEPIFFDSYYRTYILPIPPNNISLPINIDWSTNKCDDIGDWSWSKEGDENILLLRHEEETYKIDRNRGLTKEVLVEDYGVRYLKDKNQYNPDAKWATFAMNLTLDKHLDTLEIMSKYVCSAISKTINISNDYPYEDFQKVYFDTWKRGIKGITTYREGTMTNVLSTTSTADESSITKTNAPKRPKSLPCDIFHTIVKGKSYFVLVGLWKDGSPYEIFSGKNGVISNKDEQGQLVKLARPKCYRLEIAGEVVLQPITLSCSDDEEILTRMISTSLRHGVPVNFLLDQLTKVHGDMSSFAKGLARTLKKYIQDDTQSSNKCPDCGHKLIYLEGCCSCKGCGYSGCN